MEFLTLISPLSSPNLATYRWIRSARVSPSLIIYEWYKTSIINQPYLWIFQIETEADVVEGSHGSLQVHVANELGLLDPDLEDEGPTSVQT